MPPGFLSVACRAPGSERDLSCLLSSSEATRGPEAPEGLAVTLMAQTYCSYLYLFASFIAAGLAASDLQSADHEEGVRHTGPSYSSPHPHLMWAPPRLGSCLPLYLSPVAAWLPIQRGWPGLNSMQHPDTITVPLPPTLPSSPHSHLLHLPLLSPGQHWLAPPFWVAQEERSLFPDELFVLLKRALVFVSIAPAAELTCAFDPCSRTMTPRRSRPCTLCLTRLRRARSSLPRSGRPSPRRRVQGMTSVRREFQVRPAVPRPQPCGTAVLA